MLKEKLRKRCLELSFCLFKKKNKFVSFFLLTNLLYEAVKAYENQIIEMKEIKVFHNRNPFWISQQDIIYIVTYDGSVELVTKNKIYRKDIPLKELKKSLDNRYFFQVHRQFLVNLSWITLYEEGILHMGKKEVPVAKRRKKDFERVYNEFSINQNNF